MRSWVFAYFVAVLAVWLFTTVNADLLAKGSDLKKYLEGGKDDTFLILFYDRETPHLRTEDIRHQVRTKILRNHPNFNYFEVDVQEGEYAPVVDDMFKIDRKEVRHSPSIAVASEGRGYWAHGDRAVDDLVYNLGKYSIDMQRAARERS